MVSDSRSLSRETSGCEDLPIYRSNGRSLGILFSNVTAFGVAGGSQTVADLQRILTDILMWPVKSALNFSNRKQEPCIIVENVDGVLFPAEMMLVLGRPGAGCSTVLRLLANQHQAFQSVEGSIQYAGFSAKQMKQHYRSEVVYCSEDDIHFPNLSVRDTMDFAMRVRKPNGDNESAAKFSQQMSDRVLASLGLSHTKDTVVGDAFLRGVSGGERKRMSLAEVLAINASVMSWDNPIRGLDSHSALNLLELLRAMAQKTGMSNAVTLYQASEAMYEFFDRVMVMYEGKMIFCGPANRAREYFIELGFHCPQRQTTADFLTAITSPGERSFQETYKGQRFETAEALARVFRSSSDYHHLKREMAVYKEQVVTNKTIAESFQEEVHRTRSRFSPRSATEVSSIWTQALATLSRQYKLIVRDWHTVLTTVILTVINSLMVSSAYYMAPKTATGSFERSGALFFALVYFTLNAITEVPKTIQSRAILSKQRQMGYAHPFSFAISLFFAELPVMIVQSLVFSCCYYFTIGLEKTAGSFWIFALVTFTHFASVSNLFRMLGAWAPNLNIGLLMAGSALPIVCLYSGYAPPVPTMHRWGSWIRRISPSPFAMEALMGNEYADITLHCSSDQLIPHGDQYNETQYQGCPMAGAAKGSPYVPGRIYLTNQYGFDATNIWRDFGIVVAMWIIYFILTAIGLNCMTRETASSNSRVFRRGAKTILGPQPTEKDVENQSPKHATSQSPSSATSISEKTLEVDFNSGTRSFVFQNINYFVNFAGKERQLLNNITAYVRPGQLTALMGASGAGKSTLLETISGRKTEGRTEGRLQFDGRDLDNGFSRSCGFCMQQDVHEPLATVYEALAFSAFMRQSADTPSEDKIQEVDDIIELLELGPIADAMVGSLGIEEKKRVTIGVELCARPSALLFLDEPTSGLDSQAAHSIVTFLRKIAAQGIPIVCTIHQPSSVIFEMFTHALILAPGGRTVYFGETGEPLNGYFARNNAAMSPSANPAEFVITTVAASNTDTAAPSWPQVWQGSSECHDLHERVSQMMSDQSPSIDEKQQSHPKSAQQFALPLFGQVRHLTKRHWISIWRNGSYNFSKLFKSIFFQMIVAFTFFKAGGDVNGLQNHALALLIGCWVIPAIAADVQDIWFQKWALFEAREKNGIYDFKALLIALIAVETPWQIVSFTLVFFCSYWTVGYTNTPSIAGFVYLMYLVMSLFGTGFCFIMASLFPNATMAGYANSLFWVIFMMFNGIVAPKSQLNDFYRYWMTWADPMRYYFGATVSSVLHNVKAVCKPEDLAVFDPPPGQTCGEYVQAYMGSNPGYLQSTTETSSCKYCPYSVGDDYSRNLDFYFTDRWRDLGVFLAFCLSNFLIVFLATWVGRVLIRRWRK
ncbi:hypothetical protein N7452_007930 [Penicillium brevicompactum]|uniref:ABC transporter domain-containing protein n=1 Tax=Penicillium brevicompactum TaxID=5074 RepID=A0A9W9QGG9_PENBR|nr:hypothetical protein N7452_007930 [Penicillium brevicompactum]